MILPPADERPPAGAPTWDRDLVRLIGLPWGTAKVIATELGRVPIRTSLAGGPPARRPFYSVFDIRLLIDDDDDRTVQEVLVPRRLTDAESQIAGDNFPLLHSYINLHVTWNETDRRDIAVSVFTDLYLLSLLTWDPSRAQLSTYMYQRMWQHGQRTLRYVNRAQAVDIFVKPPRVSLVEGRLTEWIESFPQPDRSPPFAIADPRRGVVADLADQIWHREAHSNTSKFDRNLAVILDRLGLSVHDDPDARPMTLDELAVKYDITRERARQICAKFLTEARDKRVFDLLTERIEKLLGDS